METIIPKGKSMPRKKIEQWWDITCNPIVGCSQISDGCKNCYAERMARRQVAMGTKQYIGTVDENGWTGKTNYVDSAFDSIRKRRKPATVFIGSMTDIFHESVPDEWLVKIFQYCYYYSEHTYLILTKRPKRMVQFMLDFYYRWPGIIPNVGLGVTAENQEQADRRIPSLFDTRSAMRFVSVEPMIGPLRLTIDSLEKLDWVICGAEMGPYARPLGLGWAHSLMAQCETAGVPFFFKKAGPRIETPEALNKHEYPKGFNNE